MRKKYFLCSSSKRVNYSGFPYASILVLGSAAENAMFCKF